MAVLTCKPSVRFKTFTPALTYILDKVRRTAERTSHVPEVVITSANDSTHSPNSRHYTDEAIDLRTKNFPTEAAKRAFAAQLRVELGDAFTVLYESAGTPNEHLHVQVRKGRSFSGLV